MGNNTSIDNNIKRKNTREWYMVYFPMTANAAKDTAEVITVHQVFLERKRSQPEVQVGA